MSHVGQSWAVVARALRATWSEGYDIQPQPTPHTMLKYITAATAIAALIGFVAGTAYGAKVPVVNTLAAKLPGSKVAA